MKYFLLSFVLLGILCFTNVEDVKAQSGSTYCQAFSDVRPNSWTPSPREICEEECASGNCPSAPEPPSPPSGPAGPNPNYPSCSSCGACDSALPNYGACKADLRTRCGSGEYDHCVFRERSYRQWYWVPFPIRRKHYIADCVYPPSIR